jgi:hypothetical protein
MTEMSLCVFVPARGSRNEGSTRKIRDQHYELKME